jgi:hypothetical protein
VDCGGGTATFISAATWGIDLHDRRAPAAELGAFGAGVGAGGFRGFTAKSSEQAVIKHKWCEGGGAV